ncbi:MAG: hypothetical protein JWO13_2284 [Acidobacteriales bacterium]|nr:hypothetical protein [Terriglobales bacterium]
MQLAKIVEQVTILEKKYSLAWNMRAVVCLKTGQHLTVNDLRRLMRKECTPEERVEVVQKMIFCMTRANNPAPTMEDINNIWPDEYAAAESAALRIFLEGENGGLGKGQAIPAGLAAGSASSGTRAGRSRKRSTSAGSRRRSGGS